MPKKRIKKRKEEGFVIRLLEFFASLIILFIASPFIIIMVIVTLIIDLFNGHENIFFDEWREE